MRHFRKLADVNRRVESDDDNINIFTGEEDEDMKIISTDGEMEVTAQWWGMYLSSYHQMRNTLAALKGCQSAEHSLKEHGHVQIQQLNSIFNATHGLFEKDRVDASRRIWANINEARMSVFHFQSRICDLNVTKVRDMPIDCVPRELLVRLLNQIDHQFTLACNRSVRKSNDTYNGIRLALCEKMVIERPSVMSYTEMAAQGFKNAYCGLVCRMEEVKDQQVPEEEAFVVPIDDQKIDVEKVSDELTDNDQRMHRLGAYLYGVQLLRCAGVLINKLVSVYPTVRA